MRNRGKKTKAKRFYTSAQIHTYDFYVRETAVVGESTRVHGLINGNALANVATRRSGLYYDIGAVEFGYLKRLA